MGKIALQRNVEEKQKLHHNVVINDFHEILIQAIGPDFQHINQVSSRSVQQALRYKQDRHTDRLSCILGRLAKCLALTFSVALVPLALCFTLRKILEKNKSVSIDAKFL